MDCHLNCPLCLDGYSRPRKLPVCEHSFCTTCIHSYVCASLEKEHQDARLACPVCSKQLEGPKEKDTVIEWVKSLPLNYHLMVILQKKNQKKVFPCEPCDNRCKVLPEVEGCESHDTSPASRDTMRAPSAVYFCCICEEAYCEPCSKVHSSSRATMSHELMQTNRSDIDEVILRSGSGQYCLQHSSKKIEFFCNHHKEFLCTDCALFKHKSCRSVEDSGIVASKLSVGKITEEIEESFLQAHSSLDTIEKALQTQTCDIGSKMEEFRNEVAQVKLLLNSKIEVFEMMCLEAFDTVLKQSKEATKASEDKVKGLSAAFHTEHKVIKSVTECSSGFEASIFCHTKHQQLKKDIATIGEKIQAETPKLTYQFSSVINKILKPGFQVGKYSAGTDKLDIANILEPTRKAQDEVGSEVCEESKSKIHPQTNDLDVGGAASAVRRDTSTHCQYQRIQVASVKQEKPSTSNSNANKTSGARGRSRNRRNKPVFSYVEL